MNIVAYVSQFWIEVVLAAVIIFAVKHYLDRWRFFVLGSVIPGPNYWPIIGNTLIFQRNLDILGKFCEYNYKYGLCKVWLGSWLHIMLCSAEDAEIFCTSTALLDRTDHFKFLKIIFGDSILTASGIEWRKAKRLMEPLFKYSSIKNYFPIVQKKCDILIERLKNEVGKSTFSPLHYITDCSFDIIVESTLGFCLNAQDGNVKLLKHAEEFMDLMWKRSFTPWQQIDILYRHSQTGKNFFRLVKLTNDFADEVISSYKKSYIEEKEKLKGQNNIQGSQGKPFLQNLLDCNEWTDDEIRQHVLTIIVLGFETSSTTTCFILMMLGMHQDVQEKAYQEISKLDKDFSDVDVMKLEYLDRIIKETLRLFPGAPLTFREANDDIQFRKYVVPKGSAVGINIFAIHRDPKQYENPNAFNPDNFLPDNVSKRHPYAYIPFLIGRRKCIAEKFAMISMKIMVAKILMNFKIECDLKLKDLELCDHITLKTKNSCYPIRLLSR